MQKTFTILAAIVGLGLAGGMTPAHAQVNSTFSSPNENYQKSPTPGQQSNEGMWCTNAYPNPNCGGNMPSQTPKDKFGDFTPPLKDKPSGTRPEVACTNGIPRNCTEIPNSGEDFPIRR